MNKGVWLHTAIINPAVPGVYRARLPVLKPSPDLRENEVFSEGFAYWDGKTWGSVLDTPVAAKEHHFEGGSQNKLWLATEYSVLYATSGSARLRAGLWFPIEGEDDFVTFTGISFYLDNGFLFDIKVK